jgi:hypothetical protein
MPTTATEFRHSPDNIIYVKDYTLSFVGSGLNDLSFNGQFYRPVNAVIEIDSNGVQDTFKLSYDGGVTWALTLQPITGFYQILDHNVSILFAATTGHTIGDKWVAVGSQSAYPLAWFQTQEPAYNLPVSPPNIINQWYIQTGVQAICPYPIPTHVLQTGITEYYLPCPWADGDTYISKKAIYDAAYPQIVNFSGSGLNDMSCNGIFYLNPPSIIIKIDGTSSPDTFKVSLDGGSTWIDTGTVITSMPQTIITGVTVQFAATHGHTLNDQWTVYPTIIN